MAHPKCYRCRKLSPLFFLNRRKIPKKQQPRVVRLCNLIGMLRPRRPQLPLSHFLSDVLVIQVRTSEIQHKPKLSLISFFKRQFICLIHMCYKDYMRKYMQKTYLAHSKHSLSVGCQYSSYYNQYSRKFKCIHYIVFISLPQVIRILSN